MSEIPNPVALLGKSDDTLRGELKRHGLAMSASEARKLCGLLGRDPTRAEAFLFDVAWSEHCSYKSSRGTLQTFFGELDEPPTVVLGPGEDAGIVRLTTWKGTSYCLVMSHESHNHPSQVLPFEGAATGIGGIVRDVYCMGADVIGVLDALRFGDPRVPKCAEIARGVVDGIWRYGNALGVPNLGGDTYFDARYNDNCLVNVVALGIVEEKRIVRSRVPRSASGEPYVAILVGKPTDSSGFGGASFASADLEAREAERNLGAVQVADPFLKRVLVEANRMVLDELHREGIEVGFKDLGAGGIGGAAVELGAAGGMGIEILLDNVRTADRNLPPEIVLVGETQERFVWAVPERYAERVVQIYEREFELPRLYPGAGAVLLGRFTDDGMVLVRHRGEPVVRCRATDLTEGIKYERKSTPRSAPPPPAPAPAGSGSDDQVIDRFLDMLGHTDGASRAYVYRHYDPEVQGHTVLRPGEADATVVAPIRGCPVGVAIAVEGNPYRGMNEPYQAGAWAVAGAVRNVAAVGASPLALSDCLNFGNPEVPEVFWDFREAVRGIAETTAAIGLAEHPELPIPIITGNVSFYNQSVGGEPILSSPIVACVGSLPDVRRAIDQSLKSAGSDLVWAGRLDDALGGTLYGRIAGIGHPAPRVDVALERALATTVVRLISEGRVLASHDVGEGGLLMTVLEMMAPGGEPGAFGASIDLSRLPGDPRPDVAAFSEGAAFVLEVAPDGVDAVLAAFEVAGVQAVRLGSVLAGPALRITLPGESGSRDVDLDRAMGLWQGGLEKWLR